MDDIEQRHRTVARLLIKLSGTTLARLAYATGITGNTISRWVHGDHCALGPQGREKLFAALGAYSDGTHIRLAPRATGAAQPVFQINGLVQAERFATLAALTLTQFVAARETCQGKTLVSIVTDISGQTTALLVGTREALDELYLELGIALSPQRRLEAGLRAYAPGNEGMRLHAN
ncbi:hypothetical protein [Pandoraea apista]|uniref:hypothetical protein n=1 Tax=Pandoraea apista TaxID=93218 RepID=UPI00058AA185|nr:hypothetical protein [Pandoraea apista]AJE99102.1 hypothetical protein SG18_14545 [Pandoraea apista]AKH73198.1 hypothetical protein XM39_14740 [Pandoraea apista]AKI61594.1 hypothetical protein AA956_07080 [Pandoraea apista]ALS65339.1 hypothetical protein AT395_10350 [Pandoraea apista]RRW95113.1 hypothetical protein EGJ54_15155 [Pandoraea apista]